MNSINKENMYFWPKGIFMHNHKNSNRSDGDKNNYRLDMISFIFYAAEELLLSAHCTILFEKQQTKLNQIPLLFQIFLILFTLHFKSSQSVASPLIYKSQIFFCFTKFTFFTNIPIYECSLSIYKTNKQVK